MADEKLLTIREVSLMLGILEKELIELAEKQVIPAYKIGGTHLRFKREQVEDFKKKNKSLAQAQGVLRKSHIGDQLADFLYFNDFYIVSGIAILIILFIIFQGY